MNPGTCKFWNGLLGDDDKCCDAGVNYHQAFDGERNGMFFRIPCRSYDVRPAHGRGTYIKPGDKVIRIEIDRHGHEVIPCGRYIEPSDDEVLQHQLDSEASMRNLLTAIQVSSAWRVKPKPTVSRHEVVECPVCKGRLHLSQSSYNGHVHGKCETPKCVAWME